MPNAGKKRHVQEKKERVNAKEYATEFAKHNGGKDTAVTKAKVLESDALKGNPPDVATANFWRNIAGHIGKLTFAILFLSSCDGKESVKSQTTASSEVCLHGTTYMIYEVDTVLYIPVPKYVDGKIETCKESK